MFQRQAAGVQRRLKRKLGQNERKGGKKVKKEKKRKKTFKKRQRLKNSRKRSKYKASEKENKPKRENRLFGATNPQRKGRTNTQSRSHKQNLLQHVLDIEEKTRGRKEEINETLGESDFDPESNENDDDITQFEKTQDNPVAINTAKKEKKQKKKKRKQKQRKKKCKYTKKDLEAKNAKTCNRAKERARLSYRTMEMLFEQVYDESLIYSKVEKKENTKPTSMSSPGPLGVPKPKVMPAMPKWTPPARVNTLKKDSPDQFKVNLSPGFRVGLSRNVKVKPLHPNVKMT